MADPWPRHAIWRDRKRYSLFFFEASFFFELSFFFVSSFFFAGVSDLPGPFCLTPMLGFTTVSLPSPVAFFTLPPTQGPSKEQA